MESGAYNDLMNAARQEFSRHGFEHTTVRGIARLAGCNPKLIQYYFGSKEQLFNRVVHDIIGQGHLLETFFQQAGEGRHETGAIFIRTFLTFVEQTPAGELYLAMIRNVGTDGRMRKLVGEFFTQELGPDQIRQLGIDHAEERMMLVGTQVLGLILVRYILAQEPLSTTPIEQVSQLIGPVLDRYLYDELPLGD